MDNLVPYDEVMADRGFEIRADAENGFSVYST